MFTKALTVYAQNPEKEFEFTLNWKGVEVTVEVSTYGRITINNISALAQPDQALFRHAMGLADDFVKTARTEKEAFIQNLQMRLGQYPQQRTAAALPPLSSKGADPFDYYYVSLPSRLPKIFGDAVPAINIFVLFIASMFLIPEVANTTIGVFTAIALSSLALTIQLLSKNLEKKSALHKIDMSKTLSLPPF